MTKRHKGMSLIELMIVVVIVGILSVLAVSGYRKYVFRARSSEATQILQGIRASQELYFQSFGEYCGNENLSLWPANQPTENKVSWDQPNMPAPWKQLGFRSPGSVWFQYSIVAGRPGNGNPPDRTFQEAPTGPWFVAIAKGDFMPDDNQSYYHITSATETVYESDEVSENDRN